jgi:hypothetical protein
MFESQSSDITPDQSASQTDAVDTVNDYEREIYGTPPASSVNPDTDLDRTIPPKKRLNMLIVQQDNFQSKERGKALVEKYKVSYSRRFELIVGEGRKSLSRLSMVL